MASTGQPPDGVGATGSSEAFKPKARVKIASAEPGGVVDTDEALDLLYRDQQQESALDRELTGSLDGGSAGELESPRRFLPESTMPSGPPSFASNRGPSEMASIAQQEFTCIVENCDTEHQEPDPVLEVVPEDEPGHISFEDMLKGVKCIDSGEVFASVDQIPDEVYTNPAMLKKGSISRAWSGWRQQKNQSDEKLWSACANGSLELLKAALTPPTDGTPPAQITAPTLHGRAALHIAAEVGRPECVELLLDRKASLSQTTNSGLTPLHVASDRNHVEVVRLLLQRRADAHAKDAEGQLPVHLAAIKGYSETVREVLQSGGSGQLGTKNRVGQRPQELCIDVDTLKVFKEHAAQAAASGDCTGDGRFADDYSGRSVLGQTVRRSSRADHIQNLLNQGQRPGPSASNFVSSISMHGGEEEGQGSFGLVKERSSLGANQEPRASLSSRGERKPFAKVRLGEASEKVSPASFEYMDKLGSGSFGDVYLVRHKKSKESYAMKVLNRNRMRSSHLRYAITERNVLSYLRHPYIVQLYYSFQADTRLVLVLQYCCGGDVQGLLNRERFLQEPLAQLYACEVLSALSHIHLRDIVYRDMKPENVLIDKDGHCMLTDFGLSKERVGLEGTKSFCGSLAFIAPELLKRGCAHNRLVDVYGLGVFLYCMLVGIPPHYHRDRDTLLQNIRQARLRFPSSMNPKPQALIRSLMEREPAKRPGQRATSEIMEDEFFVNIDFEALKRREIPVPVRPSRPTPKLSHKPVESQSPFDAAAAPPDPSRGASSAPTADVNAFTFVHVDATV